jgi:hypothetical protein
MAIYRGFVLPAPQLAHTKDSMIFKAIEFATQAHDGQYREVKKFLISFVCLLWQCKAKIPGNSVYPPREFERLNGKQNRKNLKERWRR